VGFSGLRYSDTNAIDQSPSGGTQKF